MFYLLLAFNVLFLLFWLRLWSSPDKEFYFNPFLSGTIKLTDSVIAFLRPVLYMPEQAAALVILLFLTLFKALLVLRLTLTWTVTLGTFFIFSPAHAESLPHLLLFSVLHVAAFLFRLWTVYLLVRLITPPFRTTRATEALAFFARPFSRLPALSQPFVLFALHVALAFVLSRTGALSILVQPLEAPKPALTSPFTEGPFYLQFVRTGWLGALSFADGLMLLTRGLFALIIGNLGAAIVQARGATVICGEGAELLMGRFARRGTGGTGFDFTPLLFFFVADLLYNSVCRTLYELIQSPFFAKVFP